MSLREEPSLQLFYLPSARIMLVHPLVSTTASGSLSHVAGVLQPVAAVVFGQSEADVSGFLPAAADLLEAQGHAGHAESQAAQQSHAGQNQNQHEGGRQQEAVLGRVEGSAPAVEQSVDGGHGQGAVPHCGLQGGDNVNRLRVYI